MPPELLLFSHHDGELEFYTSNRSLQQHRRHVKLEMSRNNYHEILRLHQGKIREFCFLELLGTLSIMSSTCGCIYNVHESFMATNILQYIFTRVGNITQALLIYRKCTLTGTTRLCSHKVKLLEKGEWHFLCHSSRDRVNLSCFCFHRKFSS